jgi:hypothetical protein
MARRTFTVDDGVPVAPVGTRREGKHPSAVLRKAREAMEEGTHATEDEAVDAFYEEYSGRKVSDETTAADVDRQTKTKQRMRTRLRGLASKDPN